MDPATFSDFPFSSSRCQKFGFTKKTPGFLHYHQLSNFVTIHRCDKTLLNITYDYGNHAIKKCAHITSFLRVPHVDNNKNST